MSPRTPEIQGQMKIPPPSVFKPAGNVNLFATKWEQTSVLSCWWPVGSSWFLWPKHDDQPSFSSESLQYQHGETFNTNWAVYMDCRDESVQPFVLYSNTCLCLISRTDLKIMFNPPKRPGCSHLRRSHRLAEWVNCERIDRCVGELKVNVLSIDLTEAFYLTLPPLHRRNACGAPLQLWLLSASVFFTCCSWPPGKAADHIWSGSSISWASPGNISKWEW